MISIGIRTKYLLLLAILAITISPVMAGASAMAGNGAVYTETNNVTDNQ